MPDTPEAVCTTEKDLGPTEQACTLHSASFCTNSDSAAGTKKMYTSQEAAAEKLQLGGTSQKLQLKVHGPRQTSGLKGEVGDKGEGEKDVVAKACLSLAISRTRCQCIY